MRVPSHMSREAAVRYIAFLKRLEGASRTFKGRVHYKQMAVAVSQCLAANPDGWAMQ